MYISSVDILREPVSENMDLRLQNIDVSGCNNFGDVVRRILGNEEVASPLRSALRQQVSITPEEMGEFWVQSTRELKQHKLNLQEKGVLKGRLESSEQEIRDWISPKVEARLRDKYVAVVEKLLGDIPLLAFYRQEEIRQRLRDLLESSTVVDKKIVLIRNEPERELAEA